MPATQNPQYNYKYGDTLFKTTKTQADVVFTEGWSFLRVHSHGNMKGQFQKKNGLCSGYIHMQLLNFERP